jgi:hypothetical protein
MSRDAVIDAIGLAAIALWLGLSAWYCLAGNGPMFARLGALGTASAVGYFAAIKHSTTYPFGLRERLHLLNSRLNLQYQGTNQALVNTTLLASSIAFSMREEGKNVPAPIAMLGSNELIAHAAAYASPPIEQWDANNWELEKEGMEADTLVSQVHFRSGLFQAVVVVIATLQWGFGDLLFGSSTGCISC